MICLALLVLTLRLAATEVLFIHTHSKGLSISGYELSPEGQNCER
jgi:hypothetical protein